MIEVESLKKEFTIYKKKPGVWGSVTSLFSREKQIKSALKGVSFNLQEGEMVGLVGANGAGKTTIVKVLAGIVHPTAGEVSVLGYQPWKRENEFRKQVGLLMGQKAQLWWDLTPNDCFTLLKEIYQIGNDDYKESLESLVSTLGVRELLDVQVRRLSLGERMKMELIASLLHRPRVIFLDEPTLGLDLTSQRAIRNFLKSYVAKYKPAVLLTSHYMQDIEELCKRIIIIKEGEFVYDGSLSAVLSHYVKNKRVIIRSKKQEELSQLIQSIYPTALIENTDTGLVARIPRGDVQNFLSTLFSKTPLEDISIEEEDIGEIIESIMTSGVANAA